MKYTCLFVYFLLATIRLLGDLNTPATWLKVSDARRELKRPNSSKESLTFSPSTLKEVQGLRLPVFVKILRLDIKPFEKSVLLKIGLPSMWRNLKLAHGTKRVSRTDRLHQTSKHSL